MTFEPDHGAASTPAPSLWRRSWDRIRTWRPGWGSKAAGMGLVVFQPDGRMMAVLCDGRPSLPSGEPRQFMSYAGNYTFDGTTLSTHVDASSDASRVGGDQVRTVCFKNGLMVLAPPRRLYAGIMQHQELTWQRIAG